MKYIYIMMGVIYVEFFQALFFSPPTSDFVREFFTPSNRYVSFTDFIYSINETTFFTFQKSLRQHRVSKIKKTKKLNVRNCVLESVLL